MKTVIIKQKMSNTGTIHDVESDQSERKINFPRNQIFALVLSSYYGGRGYRTTSSQEGLKQLCSRYKEYSYQIVDCNGNWRHKSDIENKDLEKGLENN